MSDVLFDDPEKKVKKKNGLKKKNDVVKLILRRQETKISVYGGAS